MIGEVLVACPLTLMLMLMRAPVADTGDPVPGEGPGSAGEGHSGDKLLELYLEGLLSRKPNKLAVTSSVAFQASLLTSLPKAGQDPRTVRCK
jgi:hypothetical protein